MTNNKIMTELNKGMPTITYVKKKFGFTSIEAFEEYVAKLKEKAEKYDAAMANNEIKGD